MQVWLTLLLTLTNSDLINLLKHLLNWSYLNILKHTCTCTSSIQPCIILTVRPLKGWDLSHTLDRSMSMYFIQQLTKFNLLKSTTVHFYTATILTWMITDWYTAKCRLQWLRILSTTALQPWRLWLTLSTPHRGWAPSGPKPNATKTASWLLASSARPRPPH